MCHANNDTTGSKRIAALSVQVRRYLAFVPSVAQFEFGTGTSSFRQVSEFWVFATPSHYRHAHPKDEVLQAPHYHDPSCNRLMQKYHMPSKHLVPQPDVSKHGTLVIMNQQKFCLQGRVNNVSSPEVSTLNSNRESVLADGESILETPKTVQVSSPESSQ